MSGTDVIAQGKVISAIRQAAGLGGEFAGIREVRETAGLTAPEFDAAAIALYSAGAVNLVPRSCQQLLAQADRDAAVRCGGEDKHMVAWTGR